MHIRTFDTKYLEIFFFFLFFLHENNHNTKTKISVRIVSRFSFSVCADNLLTTSYLTSYFLNFCHKLEVLHDTIFYFSFRWYKFFSMAHSSTSQEKKKEQNERKKRSQRKSVFIGRTELFRRISSWLQNFILSASEKTSLFSNYKHYRFECFNFQFDCGRFN